MSFNSSILLSNTIDTKNICIEEMVRNDESTMIDLLEMNDSIHDIEISSKIDYYRALCNQITISESGNTAIMNESIISNAFQKLTKIIEQIIEFVKNVAKKIIATFSIDKAKYKNNLKMDKNRFTKDSWYYSNDTKSIKVMYYPTAESINDIKIEHFLAIFVGALQFINTGNLDKLDDDCEARAFKSIAQQLYRSSVSKPSGISADDVKDPATFTQFLQERMFYTEIESMNSRQWYKLYTDLDRNEDSASIYSRKSNSVEKYLTMANSILKESAKGTEEQYNAAKKVVTSIEHLVTSFTNLINMSAKYETTNIKINNNIFDTYFMHKNRSTNEAGFIHGEKFDSDTLFDNEDYRDFNRTEWLDLNITTECYEIKYEMTECCKRIALQEAIILTDDNCYNKYAKLTAMREAEGSKTKDNINNALERIKKWLETFIQNIKNRYSKNAKILKRNMQFVEKPVTIRDIKSSGDIIAGMYRIQQKLNIIPFNYDTMKDDLKDKETFFKNRILPNLRNTSQYNKRDVNWSDSMSIADYCKVYYGASMPEDTYPKCEFTGAEIEANKNNIIRFLQTENIFSAKSDLATLENESKKVYSKMQTNTTASNDQNANNNTAEQKSAEKPTNESYYSELYRMWFTEAEIEMGEKPEGQQQNNSTNSEEATAFRIYMEVYKDVILAKMTASEFIVSELMQIMIAHINSNMSPEQKKAEAEIREKENPKATNKK